MGGKREGMSYITKENFRDRASKWDTSTCNFFRSSFEHTNCEKTYLSRSTPSHEEVAKIRSTHSKQRTRVGRCNSAFQSLTNRHRRGLVPERKETKEVISPLTLAVCLNASCRPNRRAESLAEHGRLTHLQSKRADVWETEVTRSCRGKFWEQGPVQKNGFSIPLSLSQILSL